MANNLKLITTETFGDLSCNFYRNMNDDILLTREQIGLALEYKNPDSSMSMIHKRHQDRLDPLSVVEKIKSSDNKYYKTTLYNLEGILIICSLSLQPKSNEFAQWILNISNTENKITIINTRKEIEFISITQDFLKELGILSIRQYFVGNYRIDLYLPLYKLAIEFDEENHRYYSLNKEKERENIIINKLECKIIRLFECNSIGFNLAQIFKELENTSCDWRNRRYIWHRT